MRLWRRFRHWIGRSREENELADEIRLHHEMLEDSFTAAGMPPAEARSAAETDWPQILLLYTLLERLAPNPVFALNRTVAVAMARGPRAGLAELAKIEQDERLAGHHRVEAVRAHMLELAGDRTAAAAAYRAAATLSTSLPERRYLEARAAAL